MPWLLLAAGVLLLALVAFIVRELCVRSRELRRAEAGLAAMGIRPADIPPRRASRQELHDYYLRRGYSVQDAAALAGRAWQLGGSERALARAEREALDRRTG